MGLKAPHHKIQSSFAGFEFSCKELIDVRNHVNWKAFQHLPDVTFKSEQNYFHLYDSLRLAMFAYHVEIMKQSLYEYSEEMQKKGLPSQYIEYMNTLIDFLSHFRNGLLHAEGELIPRWDIKPDKISKERKARLLVFQNQGISFHIPIIKYENKLYRFSENSTDFKTINFRIRLNKNITINQKLIAKMRLVSWHALSITRKQTINTLIKYLNHTKCIPKKLRIEK